MSEQNSLCFPCVLVKLPNSHVFPDKDFLPFSLFTLCSGDPGYIIISVAECKR